MSAPYRVTRRRNGGAQINQGRSFVLLDRGELIQLAADIQNIIDNPHSAAIEAETVKTFESFV